MAITNIYAQVTVADFDAALTWYERLFDRPPDRRPMDGLAEWHLTDNGGVQVFHAPNNAGSALLTLGVEDLPQHHADLTARDVPISEITTGDFARFATVADADGNTITFAEVLAPGVDVG